MPSSRARERTKITDFREENLHMKSLFEIFPLEDAKLLLLHISDAKLLAETVKLKFLNKHIMPIKPSLGSCMARDVVVECDGTVQDITNVAEEVDLWDAAILDYFMEVAYWSAHEWTRDPDFAVFNFPVPMHQESANIKASSLCVAMSVAYLLINHLQLLQNSSIQRSGNENEKSRNIENKYGDLVATIRFMKSLFQCKQVVGDHPKLKEGWGHKEQPLHDFESKYYGILSILTSRAASSLVQFLARHFLQIYQLLRNLFGLQTERRQKVVGVPCELVLETLPQTFGSTKSRWPPPLSESLPTLLVSKHEQNFDEHVTRWLCCLPEVMESASPEDSTYKEEPSEQPTSRPQETLEEDLQKYLTLLDKMSPEQLELISKLNPSEVEEVVNEYIAETAKHDMKIGGDLESVLKNRQLNLANYFIKAAGQMCTKLN